MKYLSVIDYVAYFVLLRHDFDPQRTIMIGDRLNTDILFGKQGSLSTLLVLTGMIIPSFFFDTYCATSGITKEEEVFGADPSPTVPDYVTTSIGDLRILETK